MNGREKFKLSTVWSTRLQGVCPKVGRKQKKILPRSRHAILRKYGSTLFIYCRKEKARLTNPNAGLLTFTASKSNLVFKRLVCVYISYLVF